MSCISIGITLATVSLLIQSCDNKFDALLIDDQSVRMDKYLDCSESDIFSMKGMSVLSETFQRIGERLVVESDTCYLTVCSAKDLNISDYLFSLVKQSVNNANIQYQAFLYFTNNNEDVIVKNPFDVNKHVAITRVGVESAYGNQWSTNTYTLSHTEVTTVINAMRTSNGSVATFGSIITGCLGANAASVLVGLYGYFNDSQFSRIQDQYAMSGSTRGITLRESTMYSPTGMTSTLYSSSINR